MVEDAQREARQLLATDPDVLFLAVHVYSDLSQQNSQALMNSAPDSLEVIQLNAENFEKQGDLQKAIAKNVGEMRRTHGAH